MKKCRCKINHASYHPLVSQLLHPFFMTGRHLYLIIVVERRWLKIDFAADLSRLDIADYPSGREWVKPHRRRRNRPGNAQASRTAREMALWKVVHMHPPKMVTSWLCIMRGCEGILSGSQGQRGQGQRDRQAQL
jgi:hypothetical protein